MVNAQGNIDSCKEDEIEVSIEEHIEDGNFNDKATPGGQAQPDLIDKDRVKALVMTRQKSKNTQPD